ncbi:MAG TPA: hypothetical protein VF211_02600 [Burkholderiales bacterium]
MPIRLWLAGIVLLLTGEVVFLRTLAPLEPGNTIVHVLLYAALALVLWIATDGRRPVAVIAGVMLLGAFEAAALNDFIAAAAAAIATGAALSWFTGRGKPCVESSQR